MPKHTTKLSGEVEGYFPHVSVIKAQHRICANAVNQLGYSFYTILPLANFQTHLYFN